MIDLLFVRNSSLYIVKVVVLGSETEGAGELPVRVVRAEGEAIIY